MYVEVGVVCLFWVFFGRDCLHNILHMCEAIIINSNIQQLTSTLTRLDAAKDRNDKV